MVERAPFLTAAYSAYRHREIPEDDVEMTRVGPDTPGGEYLRRFWQPVILANELRSQSGLKAGQFVATGSFSGYFPVESDQPVVADFEHIGRVEAIFAAK